MQVASYNRKGRLDSSLSIRISHEDDDWIMNRGFNRPNFIRQAIREKIEYIKNHEVDELRFEIERRERELKDLREMLNKLEDKKQNQQFIEAKETVKTVIANWKRDQSLEDLHDTIDKLYPDLSDDQKKEIHQFTEMMWMEKLNQK